jgi:predicted CoA-binding protein
LSAIPEKIDIVDVFRRPDAVPAIVDEVIASQDAGAYGSRKALCTKQAAAKARQAGIKVVMDPPAFSRNTSCVRPESGGANPAGI